MKEKVEKARTIQLARFALTRKTYNSEMNNQDVDNFCALDEKEKNFLLQAVEKFHLSTRAYFRVLKVGRTIADLEGSERILLPHIAEALGYRQAEQ